jgi:hypothetical protein
MTRVDLRIAFRLHRFEVIGFAVLIALLTVAALVVAAQLDATGYGAHCYDGSQTPACEAMGRAFWGLQQTQVPMVQAILVMLPFLLAALIGAPLVARELERGTSRLAWSLAPSRVRWFIVRVVPALVLVFALSMVAGVALDRLLAAAEPGTDLANAFAGFGSRGVVLAARATFVFAVGVTIGAVMGRMLPALVMTAVIGSVAIAGGSYVHGKWLASEAVWVVSTDSGTGHPGDLFFDQRIRLADGRVLTWDQIYQAYPSTDASTGGPPPGSQMEALVVLGTRYGFAEARETAALAGASLVALGIAGFTVRRRRPG